MAMPVASCASIAQLRFGFACLGVALDRSGIRDMKRKTDLSDDLDSLLDDLCREWGFCNRPAAVDLVTEGALLSASEFARAVLRAEGMKL
jgi:hypothetical protein